VEGNLPHPYFFLGAAANPFEPSFDWQPHCLAKKIAAGAEFIPTHCCFDIPQFSAYMRQVLRDMGLHEQVNIFCVLKHTWLKSLIIVTEP